MPDLVFVRYPIDPPIVISGRFGESGGPYPASGHRGIDFACPEGTKVYAPADGITVEPFNDGSFGTVVCIDHPGTPWYSLYAHMGGAVVAPGNHVKAGDFLGFSGATGQVTGPHLHWQVCRDLSFPTDISRSADPLSFLGEEQPGEEPPASRPFEDLENRVSALERGHSALNSAVLQRTAAIVGAFDELVEGVVKLQARLSEADDPDRFPR